MSRQMMMNINFDTSSEQEEQEIKTKSVLHSKIQKHTESYNSVITKGIFHQNDEEQYTAALVVPSDYTQQSINNITIEKKEIKKEKETMPIVSHPPSITLLHQISYESQGERETQKEGEVAEEVNPTSTNQLALAGVSATPTKLNILNMKFESSSESEEEEESSSNEDLKTKLGLKFNELEPVTLAQLTFTHIIQENMKAYTRKEVQLGKLLSTKIFRDQSYFNSLWPEFNLYLDSTKMLVAKKMKASSTSNYYITLKNDIDDVKHEYFMAKLRSNYNDSTYHMYTGGVNPEKANPNEKVRSLEATINFIPRSNLHQPRQFEVYALALNHTYSELVGKQKGQEIGLDVLYKFEENKDKIFKFRNRKPVYSEAINGFILNFGGRVQKASDKNYILEDVIASREVMMLGKVDDDVFRMDVQWPLKPLVAFCISLANFDSRFKTD